jgi:hypothetical protein
MELAAHVTVNGADQAEEKGMEMLTGGEAGRDRGFGQEVEDKAVWHGSYQF